MATPVAERFTIHFPDSELDRLKGRLADPRWPQPLEQGTWADGADLGYMKELVAYWREGYDWRRHEAAMNGFAHFRTVLDGVPIHFIHERGKGVPGGPKPLPIMLNHGWPWTFWDFHKVIRPLADPAAFGGDPADAFDVVVPSLPGFTFSTPLPRPGIGYVQTADLWARLMTEVLGYPKFVTEGGDWGALVSAQLGHKHADKLIGLFTHLPAAPNAMTGNMPQPEDFAPEERHWMEENKRYYTEELGYFEQQSSKPMTLAYALNDSPVGLAAWLVEKRRSWSGCRGDLESVFSKDELLTTVMLYWLTQSAGSAAQFYHSVRHGGWQPAHTGTPLMNVPTGVAVFADEIAKLPRAYVARQYDLRRWTVLPRGGHFAPAEQPEAIVREIRAFARELRGA
jgi:pimeloyl-ACP methyl ester carboxylesterase